MLRPHAGRLVPALPPRHGLAHFGAAVLAGINKIDPGDAPQRLDAIDMQRHAEAVRADDRGRFGLVILNIGWHRASPDSGQHRRSAPIGTVSLRLIRASRDT